MKRRGTVILIAAIAAFSVVISLFLDFVDDTRAYRQAGTGADAIVVLTGGRGRTAEGLSLLRQGKGAVLILSGVHADADLDSIYLNQVNLVERPSIVLEKFSKSTYENALEVRRIMEERGFKSMVLITSGYHIKRAHYTFARIMPDVRIEPYSVSTANFEIESWYGGKGLGLLAVEFLKYYWYKARFAILGEPGLARAVAARSV
ncbi:MAG: YdcF family protein [Thermodesulfobacteriota bacterium]|nr:MAG: YdcF family protein [Thermodesulfobacteriota bacterium]